MTRQGWLLVVGCAAFVGTGQRLLIPTVTRSADGRIASPEVIELQAQEGRHLYAPTWLPHGGRIGTLGAIRGVHRILQDFTDQEGRAMMILSQESRSPERDRYHHQLFEQRAEATADVNGQKAYFVTGSSGERRLFWTRDDTALILGTCVLTDEELLKVARAVR